MKENSRILLLPSNPLVGDPRVHKAEALVHMGHEVTVVEWDRHGDESETVVDGMSNEGIYELVHRLQKIYHLLRKMPAEYEEK